MRAGEVTIRFAETGSLIWMSGIWNTRDAMRPGKSVVTCERCGSLVPLAGRETHIHWHELVEGAWRD